jgi:hypothetical protein
MANAAQPAANPIPMTRAQIRAELAKMFRVQLVSNDDPIGDYIQGGPGAVAAFWEPLVDWPGFAEHGLWVGPNDLRFVTTIGELVSVIDWALRHARR